MTIQVSFGALCDPIYKQVGLPRRVCAALQEMADGLTLLKIAGILTDAQVHAARRKLVKRIVRVKADHDHMASSRKRCG